MGYFVIVYVLILLIWLFPYFSNLLSRIKSISFTIVPPSFAQRLRPSVIALLTAALEGGSSPSPQNHRRHPLKSLSFFPSCATVGGLPTSGCGQSGDWIFVNVGHNVVRKVGHGLLESWYSEAALRAWFSLIISVLAINVDCVFEVGC